MTNEHWRGALSYPSFGPPMPPGCYFPWQRPRQYRRFQTAESQSSIWCPPTAVGHPRRMLCEVKTPLCSRSDAVGNLLPAEIHGTPECPFLPQPTIPAPSLALARPFHAHASARAHTLSPVAPPHRRSFHLTRRTPRFFPARG